MTSIGEAVAKALVADDSDSDRDRMRKAVIKKQLADGVISVEQLGAELALEAFGKMLREKDPTLSPERALCKAMDLHPELANLAVGN